MKKYLVLLLTIFLVGCNTQTNKFSESFLSFDTYIDLSGYTKNKDEFDKYFKQAKNDFDAYHKQFDAYNNYDGIANVKTINDNAGKKAVKVDEELYNLIKDSKEYYKKGKQKNNIALAPVVLEYKKTQEDYDAKKTVTNPKMSLLKEKAECSNIDDVVLNDKDKSIYLNKKCNKLDIGSVAKGYAADKVAIKLKKSGMKSGILNAGGNVVLIGAKNGNENFSIGIADPDKPDSYKMIVKTKDVNIVTSGDYQRYYMIDNKKMNHIIDPDTLKPGMINKSVTIIAKDGLFADYFSTESFLLNEAEIKALAAEFKFEYIIIDKNDKITISEGIKDEVEIK